MTGFLLIGVYTLGFVLPFLAVGLFTTTILELFRKHRNMVQYTVKIGGILMIIMGLMMLTGRISAVTGEPETVAQTESEQNSLPSAIGFALKDQYGLTHALSDYKGKTIFLNFWATWCPPCRAEMPDIQKLYEAYDTEGDNALIVLGVAGPEIGQEGTEEEITAFLEEQGYTYPVLMDTSGELFQAYGVSALPTTYMIDRDGNIFGYVSGMLSMDMMENIIEQTMTGVRKQ